MKLFEALLIGALAALASAQGPTFDPATGTFTCPTANGVYCSGDSLSTDIIIRCTNFVGQPARCGDNVAGQPPLGNNPARCYASPTVDSVGACEKNCIIYGGSGNTGADFFLPGCVPYFVVSSSTVVGPTSTSSVSVGSSTSSVSVGSSTSSVSVGSSTSSASVLSSTTGSSSSSASASSSTASSSTSSPSVTGSPLDPSDPGLAYGYGGGRLPLTSSTSTSVPTVIPNYAQPSQNTSLPRTSTAVSYVLPVPTVVTLPGITVTYALPVPTVVTLPVTTVATLPGTTVTYAPPVQTVVTLPATTVTYAPPVPTVITLPVTTYTPSTDDQLTFLTLPLPTTTFVYSSPILTAGPTGGSGGATGGSGGGGSGSGNGTYTVPSPSQTTPVATKLPTGPSTAPSIPSYTGAAASNAAGVGLAVLGLAAAFVL